MNDSDKLNSLLKDYFALKNDYLDFKNQTVITINRQTTVIQNQTQTIERLVKDYTAMMSFISANKPENMN